MLCFENRKNILSRDHQEWQELSYVLQIALDEFDSFKTPPAIKHRYAQLVAILKRYLSQQRIIYCSRRFKTHAFESVRIKQLKECANTVLEHSTENVKSWRIDSAQLFERYVQYVFTRVGQIGGARVLSNYKFSLRSSFHPSWALRYLEPDVILSKDETLLFADAKYKAHLLQVDNSSSIFKEAFREDLHQVLAYSSFDASKNKTALLVYPCNRFRSLKLEGVNRLADVHNQIFLLGLPFTTVEISDLVEQVIDVIRE